MYRLYLYEKHFQPRIATAHTAKPSVIKAFFSSLSVHLYRTMNNLNSTKCTKRKRNNTCTANTDWDSIL